jgi:fido (protein-threonine AMPylation protein)
MITDYTENNTTLDPDETEGLKLSHITSRDELNRWEQDNILEAFNWIEKQKPENLITEKFILELHRRMFCNVWAWAGSYRKADKNDYADLIRFARS